MAAYRRSPPHRRSVDRDRTVAAPRDPKPERLTRRGAITINGAAVRGPQGRAGHRRGRAGRGVHPALLLPPAHDVGRDVPDVPRRGRHRPRPGAAAVVHDRRWRPDMKVDTESPTTKRAQEGMLELLLANHPLDCPVCDKGGECPLQDQAFSHGPGREPLRRGEAPLREADPDQRPGAARPRALHPVRPLHALRRRGRRRPADPLHPAAATRPQVMTFPDEPFTSYFSGNTVQICPVGALTATPYRFKARPWDLAESESTCTTCSVGCRITVQSSRDQLVRYLGVDSDAGQLGLAVRPGPLRLRGRQLAGAPQPPPLVRGEPAVVERGARRRCRRHPHDARRRRVPARSRVLGGARGTNEDAFAWARLADALGVDRDAQLGDGLPAAVARPAAGHDRRGDRRADDRAARPRSQGGAAASSTCACAHAAEKRTTRIIELTPTATGLSSYAWRSLRVEAGGAAAVTRSAVDARTCASSSPRGPVVIVAGRGNLAESAAAAAASLRAAYDAVAAVQPDVKVLPALRRGNVVGALQLGLRPRPTAGTPSASCRPPPPARSTCLVLLGADPVTDCPDADLGRRGVEGAAVVVAIDTFLTDSAQLADVVLAGRRVRREGRLHHQPRGPGHRGRPAGHRRRHGAAPTGWSPPSWPTASVTRTSPPSSATSTRSPTRSPSTVAGVPRRDARRAGRQRRGRARRRRARPGGRRRAREFLRRRPQQLRLSTRGEPQAVRPRRRHRQRAVARVARRRPARLRQPGRRSTRSAHRSAATCGSSAPRARSCSHSPPATTVPRGTVLVAVQPRRRGRGDRRRSSTSSVGATDVRIEA